MLSRDAAIPRLRRTLIAPCTTTIRGIPSEVPLDPGHFPVPRWDQAMAMQAELPEERWTELRNPFVGALGLGVQINIHRGAVEQAERLVSPLTGFGTSADVQEQAAFNWSSAEIASRARRRTGHLISPRTADESEQ